MSAGPETSVADNVDTIYNYIKSTLMESGEDSPIYREVMQTGVTVLIYSVLSFMLCPRCRP